MTKDKTIDNGNGKDTPKDTQELEIPEIMVVGNRAEDLVNRLRDETKLNNNSVSLDRYHVMNGMQNEEKISFFTEFINDDDVLRVNTIEAFNQVSLLCIRKTSDKNRQRIEQLNKNIYNHHVHTHKTNMVSKARKREDAYVKILSADSSDSGVAPTGLKKFFGLGKSK